MTKMDKPVHFSRRAVLKGTGALVVSTGMPIETTPCSASTRHWRKAPVRR